MSAVEWPVLDVLSGLHQFFNFWVLTGTFGYFWVFWGILGYFWVLLGAFGYCSKLQRHQLVHSGEKSYLCFICLKGFTQRVHLNTHKKHSHPGQEGVEGGEGGEDMDTEGSEEGPLAIAEH